MTRRLPPAFTWILVALVSTASPAWANSVENGTLPGETGLFGVAEVRDADAGAAATTTIFGLDATEDSTWLEDATTEGLFGLEAPAVAVDDTCGGPGQVPCMTWSWCAWTGLFGECWGGLVLRQPYAGCDSDRLNNWGLVCVGCGGTGQPTCNAAPACAPRHNAAGLCYKCGGNGEPVCWDAPQCDAGYRNVMGFCSYAGFSNEPGTNTTATRVTQPGTGPVRGIADVHTHQFSNLGFGGVVFWGAPFDWGGINEALAWCDYTWDFATTSYFNTPLPPVLTFGYEVHGPREFQWGGNPISVAMEEGMHNVGGTGPFDGWPHYTTVSHQQMYYKWVERAFLGGLRLTVVHAVSNEALCRISKRRAGWSCNDMESVDRQIQAAKDMEWAIDWMDNNQIDGSGWYRIAYSPAHAREIIRSGRLAVVLGIEVDTLFNCRPGMNCSREYLRGQLKHYYSLGVRHVYPIHQFDNDFGGAAIFRNTLNSGNYLVAGSHFQVRDCSAEGYNFNITPDSLVEFISLVALGVPPANQADYDRFAADCNALSLTDPGEVLIEEMMDQKFIIDTDHMSRRMVDEVIAMAKAHTPNPYPLISGHTSFNGMGVGNEFSITDQQIANFKAIGGMITAPIPRTACGGTRNYPNTYRYAIERMSRTENDPFAAVALSTDMNGFGLATSPRFRSDCPPEDPNSALHYPFTGLFGGSFHRQVTGSRTFDFNTQGLAHFGLLPDFMADLKRIGMTDAELDPLYNSAESYIRMWEAIDSADRVAPPTITADVQGTRGPNGWYTSDVTVTWQIVGGVPLAECLTLEVPTDTAGATFNCVATGAGGISTSSVTIRRDATPPVLVSAEVLTPPNAEGWNNSNVQVRFTVSDSASGMPTGATQSVIVTVTAEGANLQARHDFYDRAGNLFTATHDGIRIDKTPPRLGLRFAHLPPGASDAQQAAEQARWHNAPVRFSVSADDGPFGSGVADISAQELVLATEGVAVTGFVTIWDRAGNKASAVSDPVKIDLTPPTIAFVGRAPAANAYGWNNTPVNGFWSCVDVLSGVTAPQVMSTLSDEGVGQTLTGTCADVAGNTATHDVTDVNIDMTPPVVTASAAPLSNGAGWNNTDVTLTFSATDALSGVQAAPTLTAVLTAEGTNLGASRTFTDRAGNSATGSRGGIRIDKTAPTFAFAAPAPPANAAGWNNTDVAFGFTASDALSGLASTSIPAPLVLVAEGAAVAGDVTATDVAGNSATFTSPAVRIDKTPPTLTFAAQAPLANAAGWNNTDVTVPFTAADALSGVLSTSMPSPLVLTAEGAAVAGTVGVTDVAGNSATFTSPAARIDKTAPTLAFDVPSPPANDAGWNNTDVAFGFTAADALSGIASTTIPSPLVLSAEGAAVTGDVTAFDAAGNSVTLTSSPVRIDKTPPTLAFDVQSPLANDAGWNNTDVAFGFSAADALSGLLSTSIPPPLVLAAEGAAVTGEVTATDVAGNSATFTSSPVRIDKTAPTLVFDVQSPLANGAGWNNTDVAFGFTAADALSGLLSTSIPSPLVLAAEGAAVTGDVTATDVAGNNATFTSLPVRIDKTAPVVACVASPGEMWPPNNQMRPVAVSLTFEDALSGTDAYALTTAESSESGNHITGFVVGSQALTGQVRAQRRGNGPGRTYLFGYEGIDLAGNAAQCTTQVVVPHDRGRQ